MRKIINISINTIRGMIIPVLNFLLGILGIRLFGKENWGSFISIFLWIYLLVFILNWGNKDYLLRKYSKQPSNLFYSFYSNYFTRSLLLPFSLIFVFFFDASTSLLSILLIFLIHTYNSFESLIIYKQKFKQQLIAEIFGFAIIAVGFSFYKSFNINELLCLYCISFFFKVLYLFLILRLKESPFHFKISRTELQDSFIFFLLGLSGLLCSKADLYLVNYFLPKEKISEYQIIISAFLLLQSLSIFILSPINKQFYRLNETTIIRLKKIAKKLFIPLVIIGSICIWFFLENFVELGVSPIIYSVGCIASIPAFLYAIPVLNLYKNKNEKKVLNANLITGMLNLLITLALIQNFGIKGAIISTCISQWLFLIIIKRYENNTSGI